MTFAAVAAGIGAAGSIAGSAISSSGASSAADAAQQQAAAQLAWQKQIYNEAQGNINPYIQFGQTNLPNYQSALSGYGGAMDQYGQIIGQYSNAVPSMTTPYGMSQYQQSPLYTPMVNNLAELQATPGYQMQLQQGLQAINNSAAAQGGLLSGANEMALNNYAQNQAATGFQSAWQRAQTAYGNAFSQNLQTQQNQANVLGQQANLYNTSANQYNQNVANYGTAAGVGLTAANDLANVGQSPSISNAYQNLGNANAAAAGAPYTAINQGISGLSSSLGTGLQSAYGNNWFSGIGGNSSTGNAVSPITASTANQAGLADNPYGYTFIS